MEYYKIKKEIPIIDTSAMSPAEWSTWRKSSLHIGGSEIGAILGFSKYEDAISIFLKKIGFVEDNFAPNEASQGGHIDEGGILERLRHWNGINWVENHASGSPIRDIGIVKYTFMPTDYPYLALNIDGLILSDPYIKGMGVAEAKKISSDVVRQYKSGCPTAYYGQVACYMLGLDLDFAMIALLIDGVKLEVKVIHRSDDVYKYLSDKIHSIGPVFFDAVMEGRKLLSEAKESEERRQIVLDLLDKYASVLVVTHISNQSLKELRNEKNSKVIQTNQLDEILEQLTLIKIKHKELEDEKTRIENEVRYFLQKNEANALYSSLFSVTYGRNLTIKKKK